MKIEALQSGYPESTRHMTTLSHKTAYKPNIDRVEIRLSKEEKQEAKATFNQLMKSIHGITFL